MKFIAQYFIDDELVTKVTTANEIINLYGYSDFNGVENLRVFHIKGIGEFEECKIAHSHNENVDDFDHFDIWCNIVDANGNVLETASYEEH